MRLESGHEARIIQIDSSRALDRVNHQGILYNSSARWVLEVMRGTLNTDIISIKSIAACFVRENLVSLCLECSREMSWVRYCSSCTPSSFFSILENKLYGYASGSAFLAVNCAISRR